jgi:hypothetical protein
MKNPAYSSDNIYFKLSGVEEKAAKEFRKLHSKCNIETAIGGQFEYRFAPTSISNVVTIKCGYCGEEKDITDYDSW